jgi:hypothetical protein
MEITKDPAGCEGSPPAVARVDARKIPDNHGALLQRQTIPPCFEQRQEGLGSKLGLYFIFVSSRRQRRCQSGADLLLYVHSKRAVNQR